MVSCLCITKNRVPLLKRAIACYLAQTYLNKELIIVYESSDVNTKHYLSNVSVKSIHSIEIPSESDQCLGTLRNISIQSCNGQYFCQWDDDDWYHEKRIEFQMDVIKQSQLPASILMHWLVFDSTQNKAYISPFWHWEGSIICDKKKVQKKFQYENLPKGEDTTLIKKLFKNHMVFPIMMPKLYIYVYHSNNTWHYEHWKNNIINKSKSLSSSSSQLIQEILNNRYSVQEASRRLDCIVD